MGLGHRLKVIGLIRVSKHPVCQRRVHRGSLYVGCEDRCFWHATLETHIPDRQLARFKARAGDYSAERIQDPVFARLRNFRWQGLASSLRHVAGQLAGDIRGNHYCKLVNGDEKLVLASEARRNYGVRIIRARNDETGATSLRSILVLDDVEAALFVGDP
jgi:hypothetical protein